MTGFFERRIRGRFTSNQGFLLAAIGAVIGLGNIWRFPNIAYSNGGGAFLIPYLVALLTAGIPLMILEHGLGRREHASAPLAFAKLNRRAEWLGWWMPVLVMLGIMFYYQVVIGWCANYLVFSVNLRWGADAQSFFLQNFLGMAESPKFWDTLRIPIALAALGMWAVTWLVTYREVARGIERASRIFIPLLLITTLILVVWSLLLPGAGTGVRYYLTPNWKKLLDVQVWIAAYSQIFFALAIGFGVMIAYSSYLPRKTDLVANAWIISLASTVYSLVAGLAVFGILGSLAQAKGLPLEQVVKAGPILAFVVFPEAISRLPFLRELIGVLFFLALTLAGLTTAVAIVESLTSALLDKFAWPRGRVITGLCLIGALGSMAFTTGSGLYWLDIVDHFLNQYGLVMLCLAQCVMVGFVTPTAKLRQSINETTRFPISWNWDMMIRFYTPAILLGLLLKTLIKEIAQGYGGYSTAQLLGIGLAWLAATLLVAIGFTLAPWDPGRLRAEHEPQSDRIFKTQKE